MARDVQTAQATSAGYFGGYMSEMQDVGHTGIKAMQETLARKLEVQPKTADDEKCKMYSEQLLKDLEAKGVIRTAVESANLSLNTNHNAILKSECIRPSPTATFPPSFFALSLIHI